MRVSHLAITIASACVVFAGTASAQGLRQPASVRPVALNYDYYYQGQNPESQPSPSDVVIPQEEPASACSTGCCDNCCDDQPWMLFSRFNACNPYGITIGGWLDGGVTANAHAPASRFNGPVTFNDRNEFQLNQAWIWGERAIDTVNNDWDIGGRVDFLWGTDSRFTQALGLENDAAGNPRWSSERFYQLAMPQLYAEFGYRNLSVKVGHFFTIMGYEVVPATGNFFYSHAYTMQYGEPFTHTGILATYKYGDQWSFIGGLVYGWNNWENTNNNASFIGGIVWNSQDGRTSLSLSGITGDEDADPTTVLSQPSTRSMYSLVLSHRFNERWMYVFQHDNAIQENARVAGVRAQWYGINQYLFYTINDCWKAGIRGEWFRDDDGFRVLTAPPSGNPNAGSFAGNFYEITVGLNWTPNRNLTVRPELRWDWFDGVSQGGAGAPFDDGTQNNQFLAAVDAIIVF